MSKQLANGGSHQAAFLQILGSILFSIFRKMKSFTCIFQVFCFSLGISFRYFVFLLGISISKKACSDASVLTKNPALFNFLSLIFSWSIFFKEAATRSSWWSILFKEAATRRTWFCCSLNDVILSLLFRAVTIHRCTLGITNK